MPRTSADQTLVSRAVVAVPSNKFRIRLTCTPPSIKLGWPQSKRAQRAFDDGVDVGMTIWLELCDRRNQPWQKGEGYALLNRTLVSYSLLVSVEMDTGGANRISTSRPARQTEADNEIRGSDYERTLAL
jgi:hypothetical protein